jgi:hypothetical protein
VDRSSFVLLTTPTFDGIFLLIPDLTSVDSPLQTSIPYSSLVLIHNIWLLPQKYDTSFAPAVRQGVVALPLTLLSDLLPPKLNEIPLEYVIYLILFTVAVCAFSLGYRFVYPYSVLDSSTIHC